MASQTGTYSIESRMSKNIFLLNITKSTFGLLNFKFLRRFKKILLKKQWISLMRKMKNFLKNSW